MKVKDYTSTNKTIKYEYQGNEEDIIQQHTVKLIKVAKEEIVDTEEDASARQNAAATKKLIFVPQIEYKRKKIC